MQPGLIVFSTLTIFQFNVALVVRGVPVWSAGELQALCNQKHIDCTFQLFSVIRVNIRCVLLTCSIQQWRSYGPGKSAANYYDQASREVAK